MKLNSILDFLLEFPQTQPSIPTQTATVSGAADWSKIAFDDEFNTIFNQDEKSSNIPTQTIEPPSTFVQHSIQEQQLPPPVFGRNSQKNKHKTKKLFFFLFSVYPNWCSQSIDYFPLVYQQVFEASYQSNIIQTSILYPILLLSGLRQDQLSQIWSQVNQTQPGVLIKEELFMALALIALAQNSNGIIYPNDQLYQLTEIPIPHFQIQQEQSAPPPPPPPPLYQQENFADFTSFDQIEDNIDLDNTTIDSTNKNNTDTNGSLLLLDIDFNQLHPPETQPISSETQSLASLDLPMPTLTHQDTTSQIATSDNLSLNSINPVGHDAQSVHSTNSSEPSKLGQENFLFKTKNQKHRFFSLELTQFSFFSDETNEFDSNASIWLRCFEKCHTIFSQANEIFSSIQSPNLCSEVVQNTRTREYVHHLHEIFHVHKRIYTAAIREPTTTDQITSIWKQIVVLWTNLQSFFSTAHLHLVKQKQKTISRNFKLIFLFFQSNDDEIDYSSLLSDDTSSFCSICLLSTNGLETVLPSSTVFSFNTACLTFAGRFYHATCANFYLNLIDGILPSLRRLA